MAFRSTNGGKTWGPAVKVASIFTHPFGGQLRGAAFPSVATDRTGRIYVTWPDCRFRPSCSSNDMVLTSSAEGVHWTPVTRIPIDPVTSPVDHLGGGLGVDPVTAGRHARLGLFYNFYPRAACTVRTCRLFEGYVSSTDGGTRWSAPRVLAGPMRMRQLPNAFGRARRVDRGGHPGPVTRSASRYCREPGPVCPGPAAPACSASR